MHVELGPALPKLYIKLQLGSGKVIGRSFHYSTVQEPSPFDKEAEAEGINVDDHRNLIEFPQLEQFVALCVGETMFGQRLQWRSLSMATVREAVELTAQVPVRTCNACGFQFTDDVAEEARHEVVCRHLGVMTPKEIS